MQLGTRCNKENGSLLYSIMFYCGYALLIIAWHISLSGFNNLLGESVYRNIRLYSIYLLFGAILVSLLFDRKARSPKALLIFVVSLLVAYLAQLHQEDTNVFLYDEDFLFVKYYLVAIPILVFAANRVKFSNVCLFSAVVSLICMMWVFLASYRGEIINGVVEIDAGRPRYYLGYTYPTFSALGLVNIAFSLFYWCSTSNKLWGRILLFSVLVLNLILYKLTDTRLAFLIIFMMTCIYVFIVFLKVDIAKYNSILVHISILMYPVCAAFSIITAYTFDSSSRLWRLLDKLVSGRLRLDRMAFERYGMTLFGQPVTFNTSGSSEYFFIDNGYVYVLLLYGIIPFVAVMLLFSYLSYKAIKRNDYILFFWLFLIAIYNIIQHSLLGTVQTGYFCLWMLADRAKEDEYRGLFNGCA